MKKINKKSAFSLAESIIAMMLLFLVMMLAMASITRKKSNPAPKMSISGMYACWMQGNDVHEQKFDGHIRIINVSRAGNTCEFEMDRRASKYYVIATGSNARGTTDTTRVDGQLSQTVINVPNGQDENEMKLNIRLGIYNNANNSDTIVTQNNIEILNAKGGLEANVSGLVMDNIKSCKYISLVSGNSLCPTGSSPYCNSKNLSIECVNNNKVVVRTFITDINRLNESTGSDKHYTGVYYTYENIETCTSSTNNNACKRINIKVQEKDSTLKATATQTYNKELVKYLKMIPQSMQNGLTDTLLRYYQNGSGNKGGLVLIIW